jgi:antitoxin VapB
LRNSIQSQNSCIPQPDQAQRLPSGAIAVLHILRTHKETTAPTTRVFRNGNSQAVRIPAELAYERSDIEVEIERVGDEIRIRPARRSLGGVLDKFAKFAPDLMAGGRGAHEQTEGDAL